MNGRKPRLINNLTQIEQANQDAFTDQELNDLDQISFADDGTKNKSFSWGKTFFLSIAVLLLLGFGLWADQLIRSLFYQYPPLGWFGLGVAFICAIALLVVILSEITAIMRLKSVDHLRDAANLALTTDNIAHARKAVDDLMVFTHKMPYTAIGRSAMKKHENDIIDGRSLIHLAEYHILKPADIAARREILNAAKRVSIVTAVSPRAIIDLGFVLFETTRLIRKLATIYGCRPGKLGFLSITKRVVAHLAVTGTMAAGDGILHQIIGQGLAAKLSARMGEGVVNGLMTTRIGIAAMDALRPFPFDGEKRSGLSDFTADLFRFSQKETKQ